MTTKRIVAGTAVTYLNTGISLLCNLILVPMYLYHLGKEQYGLWLVILSFVSYLGFSNFGITQSVSNFVASKNAEKDHEAINSIVATGFWLYVIIVALAMILILGAVLIAPLESFIKVSDSLRVVVVPVLVVSSIFFLLKLPLTIFNSTLRSLNLIYKEQLFGLLFTVIQFTGVLVVLWSGIGILGLSVVYGATGLLSGIVLCFYIHQLIPGFSVSVKYANKAMAKKLMAPGGYFFILQLAGGLIWATDNIIISTVLGVAEVAPYAVAFRVFMLTTGVVSVITANIIPTITVAYALNDKQQLTDLYAKARKLCFGFGLLALFLLVSVGPDLMIKWIGVDNYVGNTTFRLFIAIIFVQIILWPSDAVLVGTTQHRGYALMAVCEGIINVLLSVWWVRIWGVAGVAAATLSARLATNGWFMLYRTHVITGLGIRAFISDIVKPFVVPILGAIITIYLLNLAQFSGWYKIVVSTAAIFIIFMTLFYFLSLNRNQRIEMNKLLRFA